MPKAKLDHMFAATAECEPGKKKTDWWDVAKWLSVKDGEGLAPATVEKIRVIFGRSFVLGASWDVPGAERNPTQGIRRPKLNNARQRYLTAEEAAHAGFGWFVGRGLFILTLLVSSRSKRLRRVVSGNWHPGLNRPFSLAVAVSVVVRCIGRGLTPLVGIARVAFFVFPTRKRVKWEKMIQRQG